MQKVSLHQIIIGACMVCYKTDMGAQYTEAPRYG